MNNFDTWNAIKNYVGPVLLGFAAVGLVIALFFGFRELTNLIKNTPADTALPLVAIGGVIVLILLLTVVTVIFSVLGLTNKDQAMGLPEGSIRAVIALSLIVLFAILSVFLYQGISTGGQFYTIEGLSNAERAQFLRDHPTARDLQSQAVVVKDNDGKPLTNSDGTPNYVYTVTYRSENAASDDFAKQLLVLLGTLMTAITSFYLGAGTATSAASAVAQPADAPAPTVSGISPTSHTIADDGDVVHLQAMGNNLNTIAHAKIVRGGAQIIGTNVASSPTRVTCDIPVSADTAPSGAPWDVVLDDGGSKSVTLPAALTIA